MRNLNRWRTAAVLVAVQLLHACMESPSEPAAGASNEPAASVPSAPLMTVNQLMHAILFPLANAVFMAQSEDPETLPRDPMPSSSPNPLTGLYGGWQAIENSALGLAESAELLLIPGRTCSNGEVVNVADADWIRFVDEYRKESIAAYEAARTKDQDAMVDASGRLSETCLACHRAYRRERTPGDPTERCIPRAAATPG